MTYAAALSLGREAIFVALLVCAPALLLGLATGLIVSVFQAVTQIQEQTLAFIPKIVAIAAVLVIAGPWMLGQVLSYTSDLYNGIPGLVGQ
jgi:flagellar biosynthesis protein FliQ